MSISLADLSRAVLDTEYAVRGPIVARAAELERAGRDIVYCNIGNPQALKQKPLSWVRRVLALAEAPELMEECRSVPADAVEAARRVLEASKHGLGAYSESKGLRFIREDVAAFIATRDGIDADPEAIFLTDGASKGVQAALRMLISGPNDGIMIPIPQYPLYSATITLYEGKQVHYYLDEAHDWRLDRSMLDEAIAEARRYGVRTRAITVINPGNPTGAVLERDNIAMIVGFAKEHGLCILADEVYQENVYRPGAKFTSFAKVMRELGEKDVPLFSFHSVSKGFSGECGHRGGYFEIRNVPAEVAAQILKIQSVGLCANVPGQVATWLMVKPPVEGGPSRAEYVRERDHILGELRSRARLLADGLNAIPGIHSNEVAGAMYAFPRVELPAGRSDSDWAMALLEKEGVCVVPGSGFGQIPGTAHFRTTILPPTAALEDVVKRIARFHSSFR
ncbi:MAG: aminotransferase class I/II-fold pyridoxal phosphate-dependent enzyme [Spirochaetia bacterium]|nr:aminotransferase class I/II-fold pyridoxal phosphate-dependent enzyme [Spirochaetia bacterium]